MKLIMRADDLGLSEAINYGILKSIKDGVITCVGMMPNMKEAENGYKMIKERHICIGQHTNISVGKPICNPKDIPSLVQENGDFCSSNEIRQRAYDTIVLKEAELEIEAQLNRFREITGKNPDYFEGHAVFSKIFFQALENVARRNRLFYSNPVDKHWAKEYGIECAAFYHLDERGLYDINKYIFEDEANILDKKCAVLVFHPGYLDQYILEHSSYTLIRPMETAFLCSKELKTWISDNQIQLVDFNNYKKDI